jgi:type IV pilus assembly protein PilV
MNYGIRDMNVKRNRQTGASMIEVMVAMLILSIGLLGLAMLQGKTMRVNTNAMLRSQATLLANEIIENMRTNTTGASNGFYVVDLKSGKPAACGGCTDSNGQKTATSDLISWYDAQQQMLPSPTSKIEYSGGKYTITMQWNERGILTSQVWEVTI